ncbi:alpha-amylase family glycosyl hydrolase [Truepera radiovictrix]|uniref:Alpha-amylase n=1 Tax=Truepera radiovictrix (strain DSM 17093 / CIP 108686 / LMG 22925 / RQ-24) TaxID=649638 RepID=D7CX56_TRURR|nr:alpha-amylase family glycosyl hydrolase [Truepera radiovictrix]ADI14564.1 alpha amylase catalytic region [Truepera radiovictrix DSM 17093]WMT56886.1 alpha-amylase family glycosyl hydrolase [Truepera radiovictrix]
MTVFKWLLTLALFSLTLFAGAQPAPDSVFYEIFVRSFRDSDGDGIGDLRGATEGLDYLQDLGVTGVWLMPIHPSPSYHGYDVTDYYAIHPDYGTMADFEAFVAAAHERGIEVVLDLVVNHTSSQHPWFLAAAAGDPAYRDFYSWSDENPGWRGLGGPAWHPEGDAYYLGLFWSEMPDLNFRNPAVQTEMEAVARFWLEKGVNGFRVDAIQHIIESDTGLIANTPENVEWVRDFTAFVKSVREDAYLVGETWTDAATIARYHERAGLDVSFNYPLFDALTSAVQRRSVTSLAFALEQDERLYPDTAVRGTFISNHDQIRPGTALGFLRRDEARLRLAAGLLLTLPGVPFLYYGEELGMPNGPGEADEEKRTPMRWDASEGAGFTTGTPWHPFSTDDPAITVAAQDEDPDSLLSLYRRLIALRRARPALYAGGVTVLEAPEGVLALRREAPQETLFVLANLGAEPQELDLRALTGLETATELLSEAALAGRYTLPGSTVAVIGEGE